MSLLTTTMQNKASPKRWLECKQEDARKLKAVRLKSDSSQPHASLLGREGLGYCSTSLQASSWLRSLLLPSAPDIVCNAIFLDAAVQVGSQQWKADFCSLTYKWRWLSQCVIVRIRCVICKVPGIQQCSLDVIFLIVLSSKRQYACRCVPVVLFSQWIFIECRCSYFS